MRIPRQHAAQLDTIAGRFQLDRSACVRQAIAEFLVKYATTAYRESRRWE